ncbi:putative butyrophilin subfamily 2 member A3 isoform X2 [Betta splendens]|uniref:Butyrophilin subfamily 2 member A3 isoform X2 n=1 Tax=Betta splendens TaxID=158456 RepID=A0A6P7L3F9_BETSP|nr:putative butyrophilin subfamily 2 member A3 isoform X2 [Betta splendens]
MSECWILLFSVCFLVSASEHVTNVTAEPGRVATLPCTGSVHTDILTVEWRRAEEIVCVNTRPESSAHCENEALPSSGQKRVQLSSGSKERDVSLVLNNVTNEDDGTYECYVQHNNVGGNHRPDEMTLLCTVHLQVEPGDTAQEIEGGVNEDGGNKSGTSVALIVGVVFAAAAAAAAGVAGVLIYKNRNKGSELRYKRAASAEEEKLLGSSK